MVRAAERRGREDAAPRTRTAPGPAPRTRTAPGPAPLTTRRLRLQRSQAARAKVLKMLVAMEGAPEASRSDAARDAARDLVEDFLTTGRTGRRNAMADILGEHAATSSGGLSERMEGLSTDQPAAGPSAAGPAAGAGQPGQKSPDTAAEAKQASR